MNQKTCGLARIYAVAFRKYTRFHINVWTIHLLLFFVVVVALFHKVMVGKWTNHVKSLCSLHRGACMCRDFWIVTIHLLGIERECVCVLLHLFSARIDRVWFAILCTFLIPPFVPLKAFFNGKGHASILQSNLNEIDSTKMRSFKFFSIYALRSIANCLIFYGITSRQSFLFL